MEIKKREKMSKGEKENFHKHVPLKEKKDIKRNWRKKIKKINIRKKYKFT